jgi:hypothetical protein
MPLKMSSLVAYQKIAARMMARLVCQSGGIADG